MEHPRSPEERYRRLALLGEGASGKVWLVEDQLRPGSRLALKETDPDQPLQGEVLRREFVMLSRLRHPGVVEAIDLTPSSPDLHQSLLLEFVDGTGIAAVVAEEGPAACVELAAEALRVLAYLHDQGLLHRDLKPANLLVRKQPRLGCRLVLLDLGHAQAGEHRGVGPASPVGTLPYLAPELFGGEPASPRSDLYSLGALLYEVVYGRPPHAPSGNDLTEFIKVVQAGERPRRRTRGSYSKGFVGWIEALLAPEPSQRPADAREALARLNNACGTAFAEETAVTRAARVASDPPAGRDAEFRELWAMLEPHGGSRIIWLQGAAGTGKSRMLRWLRTEAILHDWDVSAPLPATSLVPQEGYGDTDGTELLRRLRERAASRPTLILLDEVESADAAALDVLDRIARECRPEPLHVVAALRPGEVVQPRLRRLLDDTARVPTLRRVDLEPLALGDIRAIAERATGSHALSDARVAWLLQASEGNPLMLEALLVEGASRGRRGGPSQILEHSVASRLALLSESGRTWLEALAALVNDAPESTVATLAGLDPESARDAAEECRLAGLARMEHGRWSPDSRTVTASVMARSREAERGGLLRRAAELVSALPRGDASPWRLARLWSAAGEQVLARDCALEAAAASVRRGAPERAAEQYAFALRQFTRADPARLELRRLQAAALMSAGRYPAAARAYGAALRLDSDGRRRTDLLGRQAHALVHAGRFDRARAAAEEVLERTRDGGQPLERARAQQAIGIVLGRLGRESEALDLFEAVLATARELGETEIEAEARQNLATCKARLNRDDAEDDFRRAIELYRKLGSRGNELRCLVGLATIHMRGGQFERAGELLEDVRRRSTEHGQLDLLETALSKLASLFTEQGKLDRALNLAHEALDQARLLGDRNRLMIGCCRLAEALIGCGRSAKAVALLRDALADSTEQVEPDMIDSARMLLAQALLETPGARDEAIREPLAKSLDGFRSRGKTRGLLMALAIEMERRATTGTGEALESVHREFESLAAARGVEPEPEIRLRSELARGTFLLARGSAAQARDEARSAARIAASAGLAAYGARALALEGEALEQLSRKEEASKAFEEGTNLLSQAAGRIADPGVRQSFVERGVFRALRARRPASSLGNDQRLFALYDMIRALNSESDPDALLETLMDMALRAVPTERGLILLRDPPSSDHFSVHLSRNIDGETETRQDAVAFSRSIVAQAGMGRSILALDAGHDLRFRDLKSVSLYGIRSLMCVPLRSRGTVIGTVYLDSRKSGVLITAEDLRFMEAFADHAALALANARERAELLLENTRLQHVAETRVRFGNIVGRSPAMQQVFDLIDKVSTTDLPVLIQGESGTGKELVARAVHFHGHRKRKVFVSENCAAIPESLLESELFGHVKGAFTGADRDRRGLFEQADGGTLFLDEIGDMSAGMQARLLRALQEGELRRVGGDRPIRFNVRIIAATHRDLVEEVRAGRFREDLLYRLQVVPIRLLPLRKRPEDISPLIDHMMDRIASERGRPAPVLESHVRTLLERFPWPGNVRQLENTLQRLVLLAGDEPISTQMLRSDDNFRRTLLGTPQEIPRFSLEDATREQLRNALRAADGNRERAAQLLGISRATIYRKLRDLGLSQVH